MSLNDRVMQNIKTKLDEKGYNASKLAAKLGVTRQAVSNKMNGKVDFSTKDIEVISEWLEVPVIDFFRKQEDPKRAA